MLIPIIPTSLWIYRGLKFDRWLLPKVIANIFGAFVLLVPGPPLILFFNFFYWFLEEGVEKMLKGLLRLSWWFVWRGWRSKRVLGPVLVAATLIAGFQYLRAENAMTHWQEESRMRAKLLEQIDRGEADYAVAMIASRLSRYTRSYEIPTSGKSIERAERTLAALVRPGAPRDVQVSTVLGNLRECRALGLSDEECAAWVALLEVESGLSWLAMPYAPAQGFLSTAVGPAQLLKGTGENLGLTSAGRLNVAENARAALALYMQSGAHNLQFEEGVTGLERACGIFNWYYRRHRNPGDLEDPVTERTVRRGLAFLEQFYPAMKEAQEFEGMPEPEYFLVVHEETTEDVEVLLQRACDTATYCWQQVMRFGRAVVTEA